MNRKFFFLTVITLVTLVYATSVFAQEGGRPVLDIVSGNLQIGVVNTDLEGGIYEPLTVVLYNELDVLPDEKVEFEVITPLDGYLYDPGDPDRHMVKYTTDTNANGQASINYHLGKKAGSGEDNFLNNVVTVTHTTGEGVVRTVTFKLGAVPDEPASINIVSGDDQEGMILNILPESLTVQVEDKYGNPYTSSDRLVDPFLGFNNLAPRAEVTFTALNTGTAGVAGELPTGDIFVVETDDSGRASASFRLGAVEGTYEVRAAVTNPVPLAPIETEFTDLKAGFPAYLPRKIVVTSPIEAIGVQFPVVTGVPGEPLIRALDDEDIRIENPDGTLGDIDVGEHVAFEIEVQDADGNPVPGWSVTFAVTKGGGTLSGGVTRLTVTSDLNGRASALLTLGMYPTQYYDAAHPWLPELWENEVTATIIQLDAGGFVDGEATAVFEATAIPPTELEKDPDGSTAGVQPLRVDGQRPSGTEC